MPRKTPRASSVKPTSADAIWGTSVVAAAAATAAGPGAARSCGAAALETGAWNAAQDAQTARRSAKVRAMIA